MGSRPVLVGLDTVLWVYHLERHPDYLSATRKLFHAIEAGKLHGLFSIIGMIELLTGPKQRGRVALVAEYRHIVSHFPHVTIAWMNPEVVEHASDLRAKYGLRTPDAIHLATSIAFGADRFITNDRALKKVREMKIELVDSRE